jgi:hypothetical protein
VSWVTNVLITCHPVDDETGGAMEDLLCWFEDNGFRAPAAVHDHAGGNKAFEVSLYAGAYNAAWPSLSGLLGRATTLYWEAEREVEIMWREQEDETWRVWGPPKQ